MQLDVSHCDLITCVMVVGIDVFGAVVGYVVLLKKYE